jgi:hypothetical protein
MPDEPPAEGAPQAPEEEAPKGMVAYPDPTVTAEQYAEKEKSGAPPTHLAIQPAGQASAEAPAEPPPVDGEVVHQSTQ